MDACSPERPLVPASASTLRLRLVAIRYAAAGIHLYEFTARDGAVLPAFTVCCSGSKGGLLVLDL